MSHVVKRKGHKEEYDEKKVYASAYAASLNVHLGEVEAEKIAKSVMDGINSWIKDKTEVGSQDIFEKTTEELAKLNKDASFMYETHRDVS